MSQNPESIDGSLTETDPILSEIGDTPLVAHPDDDRILMKMERENPTLSHKDRLGVGMICRLRESGELRPNQRVVEASSGNTAGAVALAANRLDHPCTIVMRETGSPVKKGFVRSLGADIVEAPDVGHEHDEYYQSVARRIADEHDAVYLNQYERSLNREIHREWIGPELAAQLEGEGVTHVVGAVSTGGVMSGIGEYFAEARPEVEIIGVDGVNSNVHRDYNDEERSEYDVDTEGLGQWRTTDVMSMDVFDDIKTVSDETVRERARREAAEHGVLLGLSSGAAMHVTRSLTDASDDHRVVSIVHDGPEQYFQEVDGW